MFVANRIRAATEGDSTVNGIVILDFLTMAMPIAIEDCLEELEHLFDTFL